ncbi:MAG: molecular chaperone DnaJ [Frankiaceae bacterium]
MSTRDYIEKDYYKALGVAKDASAAEIKKAYRKLARQHHPDKNAADAKAEARFKEVSEAYDVLSDATKRKEYDEARSLFGSGGFRVPTGGSGGGAGGINFDLNDLLGQMGSRAGGAGGGLGDILGGLFGNTRNSGTRGGQMPRKGTDLDAQLTLGFADAVEGVTAPLRMTVPGPCATCAGTGAKPGTVPRVCPECSGTGHVSRGAGGGFAFDEPCRECRGQGLLVDDPCPTCAGTGHSSTERSLTVRIPPGVSDGQRIRIKGKGGPGERGGPAGDLVVTVHVTPHPVFGRKGDNLTVTVPVTFPEAALGAAIPVPTLNGLPVSFKVPPGTPSGRTMRVRGKGVPHKDGTRGDLLVTLQVAVPAKLSGKAKDALETFAEEATDDPRATLREAASRG